MRRDEKNYNIFISWS